MTDIVTRLRKKLVMEALGDKATYLTLGDCLDAADEIERLRADVKRWSNWAIDYACDDMKCECDRCLTVRTAWEATVNGNR